METTDITITQIERFIKKIAQKFPVIEEPTIMTDIHLVASQESGELLAFDDYDEEITRCVIDEWINCSDDNFYDLVDNNKFKFDFCELFFKNIFKYLK